jgi:predicted DNA-binding mobile mystery protein A
MIDRFKHLQLKTLDQHLAEIRVCDRPSDGWIRAIRKSLGMSVRQLATRMGVSQQAVSQLEAKELSETVSIKTLRKAAEALNCRLVYALIPNDGGLQGILDKQALMKAKDIVSAVDHTMKLEAQGVGNFQQKIKETAEELARNPNAKLWE